MIIGALLGGLVLSVGARVGVPGTAARAALPDLPPAGSCVRLYAPSQRLVPCTDPHDAEVTASWRAGVGTAQDRGSTCGTATAAYLGRTPDAASWHPPPVPQIIRVIAGPDRRVLPTWSWQACVVVPQLPNGAGAGFSGRLAGSAAGPAPAELRSCFQILEPSGDPATQSSGPRPADTRAVPCRTVHDGEVLAVRRVQVAGPPTISFDSDQLDADPDRAAECTRQAAAAAGAADPTYGGRLRIQVRVSIAGTRSGPARVPGQESGSARYQVVIFTDYHQSCSLEAVQGRLIDTLVGVGDDPLPLR